MFRIYILSMTLGLLPYAIERTLISIKLKKDGYKVLNDHYENMRELKEFLTNIFLDMIPVVNLINGFRYTLRLIDNKYHYNIYKGRLLINNLLVKKNGELTEEELDNEMLKINNNLIDGLDINEETKNELRKATEIAIMVSELSNKGLLREEDIENMDINECYDYLNKLKDEIKSKENDFKQAKSYEEMDNREKIEYLNKAKEELINQINEDEKVKKLEKKK